MDGSKIKSVQKERFEAIVGRLTALSQNKSLIGIIKPFLWALCALAVASVEAPLGVTPFGVALICASQSFTTSSAALCGAVLGCIGMGGYGIWQIGICVGAYIFRFIFSLVSNPRAVSDILNGTFREKLYVRLLLSVSASIAAGTVTVLYGANMYVDIFAAVIGFALYPAFTYAFYLVSTPGELPGRRMAGLCGVLFVATLAISSWGLPFNAGAIFALGATLYVTFSNGAIAGAAAGIFCAMAMEPLYAAMYPLAAFTAGVTKEYSRQGAVVFASTVGMCWSLRAGGFAAMGELLPELLFATAVMAPLAGLEFFRGRELFRLPKEILPPEDIKGKELEKRLGKLSVSLSQLSELLISVSDKVQRPTPEEAERICSSAVNKYCKRCIHRDICGGMEASEVVSYFSTLKKRLCERGSASAELIPARLASRCHNADSILEYVNTASKINGKLAAESCKTRLYASDYKAIAALLRESSRPDHEKWARDRENEIALRDSLSDMGAEFSGISVYGKRNRRVYLRGMAMPNPAGENDLRKEGERVLGTKLSSPEFTIDGGVVSAYMYSRPKFRIEGGRYSSAGEREKYSGDTVTSFENEEGYYYTLVSDGMGSGREAALTSGISAVFLEKLLMAGAPMKSSLEMLNAFICGGEGECFTTVDLMETDLYTGKTSFIKSGAAPSFVLREGKVFRLHSKTVPIGIIRALDAEVISFDIREGDSIIMMSDGVTGSYEACPWLYEALESSHVAELSPAKAAKWIGELAAKHTGKEDDISVAVMNICAC